jgi:cell division protein ZapA (FtsZ GTPase activity inhibitor)
MEENENRVRVVIAGEEYTIKGEADGETISKISEYVNGKISEVSSGITSKERYKAAILAAVNITGELFETRKELAECSDKLDQFLFKAKEISEKLENVVELQQY